MIITIKTSVIITIKQSGLLRVDACGLDQLCSDAVVRGAVYVIVYEQDRHLFDRDGPHCDPPHLRSKQCAVCGVCEVCGV